VKPYNFNDLSYYFQIDKKGYIIPGVRVLKGIGEKNIEDLIKNKPYKNMTDFLTRVKCNRNILETLNNVGFFENSFGQKLDLKVLPKVVQKKKVLSQNMFE
jgi:DNA polymerase III alpha subunit